MPKVFQRIRERLLRRNRFTSYLLYALGEIILVVAGILIALWINDWNEQRKADQAVRQALRQVRVDLRDDIKEADELFAFFLGKDSLMSLILEGKLTEADYRSDQGLYYPTATTSLELFYPETEGFQQLQSVGGDKSAPYDSLFQQLKSLYGEKQEDLNETNELILNTLRQNLEYMKRHATWLADLYRSPAKLSDASIDFFLNDPYYQNSVAEHFAMVMGNQYVGVLNYRNRAVKLYERVSEFLNIESLPLYPVNAVPDYTGTYYDAEDTLDVLVQNGAYRLRYREDTTESQTLIPFSAEHFTTNEGGFYYVERDTAEVITGFTIRYGDQRYPMERLPKEPPPND